MTRSGTAVLVVGLDSFGASTAEHLMDLGREVMAIERDPELVKEWSSRLTYAVEADPTNIEALRQLGAGDFRTAVVDLEESIEDSVLTTAHLVDLGVEHIWAKAVSGVHATVLSRVGAEHVLRPDREAGARVAHLVSSRALDYIEFDEDDFAVVKMRPPLDIQGLTLAEAGVRALHGVTVVGVKSPGREFVYAEPSTRVEAGDVLIVAGDIDLLGRFAVRR